MSVRDCEGGVLMMMMMMMMMMMRVGERILSRVQLACAVETTPSTTAENEDKYAG